MRQVALPPSAPVLLESLRAIGYDAAAAVADLVDNVANAMAGALLLASDGRGRGLGFRSDVGEIRVVPADRGLDLPTARDVRVRQF